MESGLIEQREIYSVWCCEEQENLLQKKQNII